MKSNVKNITIAALAVGLLLIIVMKWDGASNEPGDVIRDAADETSDMFREGVDEVKDAIN